MSIAAAVVARLIERGSDQDTAHLVADLALVVFKQTSRLWMNDPTVPYADQLDRAARQARETLTEGGRSAAARGEASVLA